MPAVVRLTEVTGLSLSALTVLFASTTACAATSVPTAVVL